MTRNSFEFVEQGTAELSTATPSAALPARGGGAVGNSGLERRFVVVLTGAELSKLRFVLHLARAAARRGVGRGAAVNRRSLDHLLACLS